MSRRQLVLDALHNKPVERVPVSFWFHFVQHEESFNGLEDSTIIQRNIDGHKQFFREALPDFVKLMSDGFFKYPTRVPGNALNAAELRELRPIGPEHPWIVKQVELVKTLTDLIGAEVLTFYNVFAPATYFKFLFAANGDKTLADFIAEDKEAVKHALDVIAEDITTLAHKIITEGNADGIYLSVQNVQDARVTAEIYREVVAPGELKVLAQANQVSENNILHVCGFERSRNDLSLYVDYESKAINWAVNSEHVSLAEGKALFGGRAVIGGFDNNRDAILYSGSKEEIEDLTEQTLRLAGNIGIILGADCTLPNDVQRERIHWVRDKAASL